MKGCNKTLLPKPFAMFLCGMLLLAGASSFAESTILFHEPFDYDNGDIPSSYWYEGNGKAAIQNGRLVIDAYNEGRGGVGTVWLDMELKGNLRLEFDAHVVSSVREANNINFFLLFSDPSGESMRNSRAERSDGAYQRYGCAENRAADLCAARKLNGYIITYLANGNEDVARFRLRDAPGFHLLAESFAYHNRQGRAYRIGILKEGNKIQYMVDGTVRLSHVDNAFNPVHDAGIMGFRTWNTKVWFDNFRVVELP